LAWWAAARLRHERERACDDCVLAAGVRPSDYADDLLAVARSKSSMLPAPAMAAASNLETRLRAVFDPSVRRQPVSIASARAFMIGVTLSLLPFAPIRIAAQSDDLSVAVYDASGAAIPDATISIASAEGGQPITASSGMAGSYVFTGLPSGRYEVKITKPGFTITNYMGVQAPGRLDAILSLGQITESVTVSGKGSRVIPSRLPPQRIRVGGNVQAAKLLYAPKPIYPTNAESAGIDGTVLLRAVITIEGNVIGLSVLPSPLSSSDPALKEAAMDAARQWRYQPTLLNGKPVEVITTVSVNFRLAP
jgi:TonB family protein